jgi:hypothetical protein
MVYSIVRHLWKLSKSKKFLPLPPLPLSQQEHSTNILEFFIDSIPDAEGEISASSTSVLESISSHHHYNFRFGNFHHSILDSKPLIPIIHPRIDGSTIKIGEIICCIVSETSHFNAKKKVEEFATDQEPAPVCENLFTIFDQFCFLQSGVLCFPNSNCISKNELCDLDYLLAVETVFDPGGVAELISVAKFSGTITLTFSMSLIFRLVIVFAIEFAGEFAVIVFDPGGNQLTLFLVNY